MCCAGSGCESGVGGSTGSSDANVDMSQPICPHTLPWMSRYLLPKRRACGHRYPLLLCCFAAWALCLVLGLFFSLAVRRKV
jgi:hypothetical protein